MVPGVFFPAGKPVGVRVFDHDPPFSTEIEERVDLLLCFHLCLLDVLQGVLFI
jgi:hypothetical protein